MKPRVWSELTEGRTNLERGRPERSQPELLNTIPLCCAFWQLEETEISAQSHPVGALIQYGTASKPKRPKSRPGSRWWDNESCHLSYGQWGFRPRFCFKHSLTDSGPSDSEFSFAESEVKVEDVYGKKNKNRKKRERDWHFFFIPPFFTLIIAFLFSFFALFGSLFIFALSLKMLRLIFAFTIPSVNQWRYVFNAPIFKRKKISSTVLLKSTPTANKDLILRIEADNLTADFANAISQRPMPRVYMVKLCLLIAHKCQPIWINKKSIWCITISRALSLHQIPCVSFNAFLQELFPRSQI